MLVEEPCIGSLAIHTEATSNERHFCHNLQYNNPDSVLQKPEIPQQYLPHHRPNTPRPDA